MIKRDLFDGLLKHLSKPELSLIIGPRQSGKTTLMLLLQEYLKNKQKSTVYFNLDIERDRQFFHSQADLINKIKLEIGTTKGYVFVDEIQRKENAGLFLKGIYDGNLPYKFIVSGSGSLELKEKIHESLAGRKRIFELTTLSFTEFVNFKTNYKYEKKLEDFFHLDFLQTKELLIEYLNFGGYPKIVLEEKREEKQKTIDEIYQSYLEKDISYLLKVEKVDTFTNLLKLLASQIGNLVNYSELSSTLGISVKTLRNYLWYLEKTFILSRIAPYYRNIRKEITKSPLFYFSDLGLRNYALGIFGQITFSSDTGFLFQNFVFNLLKEKTRQTSCQIGFWRTKDGAEVDFVIDKGREIVPLEVKCKEMVKEEITRSFYNFLEKYKPVRAFIVNLNMEKTKKIKNTKVYFLPFYKLNKSLF